MSTKLIAVLASASLATTGVFAVSATRAADVLPAAPAAFMADGNDGGERCQVEVVRSEPPGVANVTRSVLPDGQCLCTVKTGPEANNGSAETVVRELLERRSCVGAPPPVGTVGGSTAGGTAAGGATAGGGMSGGVIGGLVGALAVGGLAAGLGGKSKG